MKEVEERLGNFGEVCSRKARELGLACSRKLGKVVGQQHKVGTVQQATTEGKRRQEDPAKGLSGSIRRQDRTDEALGRDDRTGDYGIKTGQYRGLPHKGRRG
jgi:hypothetical protein